MITSRVRINAKSFQYYNIKYCNLFGELGYNFGIVRKVLKLHILVIITMALWGYNSEKKSGRHGTPIFFFCTWRSHKALNFLKW